jgi:hypothetical protein
LTVSLSVFLPPGGGVRDKVAEGVGLEEGLPLRRVLVLEYGLEDSRAAEVGGARVERRVGGMARVRVNVLFGRVVVAVVWKGAVLFAGAIAVEVESCPNAKLSIKLARSKHLLGASPLPSHAAGVAHRFSPLVVSLSAHPATVHRRTPHTSRLTSMAGFDRLTYARDVASCCARPPKSKITGSHCRSRLTAPTELEEADTVEAQLLQCASR